MSPHQSIQALHAARLCLQKLQSPMSNTVLHVLSSLEVGTLGRLWQLFVGGRGHVSSDFDQDGLHSEVAFPVCDAGEFGEVDLW